MTTLTTPLVSITTASIYQNKPLPARMAKCTPDMAAALGAIIEDLRQLGHELRLSDLFRSYDMQKQSHLDYKEGRKKAYSPPPGGSMHEAGRAMDIDLASIGVTLSRFWEIAAAHGFMPIIDAPVSSRSEAWHFDCRGSHDAVYTYAKSGKAGADTSPYRQMAMSAILAIGVPLDTVPDQEAAFVQAALIRLGFDPGRIDGIIGDRTRAALAEAGVTSTATPAAVSALCQQLQARFPLEYPSDPAGAAAPAGAHA
ncbi:MAG: D-alanyl-D-alanine carboxypeptidase family protein [Deltaproteobacteria bacterium]|nr:D-alanyl-D-alanine carboxypeptidase family protein [Deltaproteobacteria bacterium]